MGACQFRCSRWCAASDPRHVVGQEADREDVLEKLDGSPKRWVVQDGRLCNDCSAALSRLGVRLRDPLLRALRQRLCVSLALGIVHGVRSARQACRLAAVARHVVLRDHSEERRGSRPRLRGGCVCGYPRLRVDEHLDARGLGDGSRRGEAHGVGRHQADRAPRRERGVLRCGVGRRLVPNAVFPRSLNGFHSRGGVPSRGGWRHV
mmetsp:Transcript_8297/g.23831  ORF Transcript_8297/g.23831 Transcript_8297/m.23831 type:complete len:206 (-) Transcript_8297:116-733(-)